MSIAALVSVEEYTSSVYDPDVDYVDGELEDRNVGEKDHAKLQFLTAKLLDSSGKWFVAIETRLRVSATRFRVPDICVYRQEPEEQVFITPPLLIVEILSPEDRMSRMQRKVEDYISMGCQNVWILDPTRRKAYRYDGRAMVDVQDRLVADEPELTISLSQIFKPERLT